MRCRRRFALLLFLAAAVGIFWTSSNRHPTSGSSSSVMVSTGAGRNQRRLTGSENKLNNADPVDRSRHRGSSVAGLAFRRNSTENYVTDPIKRTAGTSDLENAAKGDLVLSNHDQKNFHSQLLERDNDQSTSKISKSFAFSNGGDGAKTAAARSNHLETQDQCRPRHNLVFWKTHKCGSSTVQNIVFRYAESNGLRLLLPPRTHLFDLLRRFNASRDVPQAFLQPSRPFNVFAHHARFSAPDVEALMPQDSYYVTILRSPSTHFESVYAYLELPRTFGNESNPLKIKGFLKNPYKYYNATGLNVHKRYARNPLLYDLGLEPKDMGKIEKIADTISDIETRFHLVMIMEYFDESLILLKELMCWSFDDIAYLKLNARENARRITPYTQYLVHKWNHGDMKLYRHFNDTLWLRIYKYGVERMRNDVATLLDVNARLMARCVQEKTNADEIQGQELTWHPNGIDIVGYQLRETAMNDGTCRNLVKPEKIFTDDIRERQGDYFFPLSPKEQRMRLVEEGADKRAVNVLSAMIDKMQLVDKRLVR